MRPISRRPRRATPSRSSSPARTCRAGRSRANQTVKVPLTPGPATIARARATNCDAQPLRGARGRHGRARQRPAGHADRQAARLPLGRRSESSRQIPFQVDEVFTRYLDNAASGFALYSGEDQHTTYAYDREGFRYTRRATRTTRARRSPVDGRRQDHARPGQGPRRQRRARVHGLRRRRPRRRPARRCRRASTACARSRVADPTTRRRRRRYVYVMRAARPTGRSPAFDAANGYVHYQRDANADTFEYSQSSYGDYGNAAKGSYCDARRQRRRNADGTPEIGQRRPRDYATITTAALPLPLRRPLADDAGRRSRHDGGTTLRPRPRRPLEGARVRAGPGLEDAVLRLRGGGHQLGRLVARCSASGRPGARDPRDLGRRLGHQRHPPRDLLPRRDAPEDLAARARRSRRSTASTRSGTSTPAVSTRSTTPHNPRAACRSTAATTRSFGNFDDPCNPRYDDNDTGRLDAGLPAALPAAQRLRPDDALARRRD